MDAFELALGRVNNMKLISRRELKDRIDEQADRRLVSVLDE
jgi:hypothetical protein